MILFDQCATCPQETNCCYSNKPDTDGDIRISLVSIDVLKNPPRIGSDLKCEELGGGGCKLEGTRPLSCKLHPFFPILDGDILSIGISSKCPAARDMIQDFFDGDNLVTEYAKDALEILKKVDKAELAVWSDKVKKFRILTRLDIKTTL